MAIVKASYQTRSKGTKGVMDSYRYYSYREGPDLAQRQWYDRDGRALDFDEAKEEIRERAEHYGYTYRVILSTEQARLAPDDYRAVLGQQFPEYYLIEHANTEHPHAHVMAFNKKTVPRDELEAMRERLGEREQVREQERAKEQVRRQEQEQERVREQARRQELDRGWDYER
ncbi:MAG: hypothetical protein H0X37_18775 [Herpetosiphonaceae bacterium]|nr:hypothetical protein [Herpetosiphonaceae bacterium]